MDSKMKNKRPQYSHMCLKFQKNWGFKIHYPWIKLLASNLETQVHNIHVCSILHQSML
jgi:hypothetical protein